MEETNDDDHFVEQQRRELQRELNENARERKELEECYGKVWSTDDLRKEFEVIGFMAPYVVVRRLSDNVKGSLEFQHSPRYYFNYS